jgi:transcriptional regulator with XRE-family HTH domain
VSASDTNGQELAKRARQATGLGQAAFARLLGLHHTTVWSWEHGQRRPNPRMRSLLRLVELFPACSVEVLRDERGPGALLDRRRGSQREVLAALRRLAADGRRVPLDRLRAGLTGLPPETQDRLLLALEARGRVSLHPPLFPGCLSATEREALLEAPGREPVLFVEALQTLQSTSPAASPAPEGDADD